MLRSKGKWKIGLQMYGSDTAKLPKTVWHLEIPRISAVALWSGQGLGSDGLCCGAVSTDFGVPGAKFIAAVASADWLVPASLPRPKTGEKMAGR